MFVAVVLGFVSLAGLVFPPAFGLGVAAIVLGLLERVRIRASAGRLRGMWLAWVAIVLGVIGCLFSLVLPGFVVFVYIYAFTHGGQFPPGMEP